VAAKVADGAVVEGKRLAMIVLGQLEAEALGGRDGGVDDGRDLRPALVAEGGIVGRKLALGTGGAEVIVAEGEEASLSAEQLERAVRFLGNDDWLDQPIEPELLGQGRNLLDRDGFPRLIRIREDLIEGLAVAAVHRSRPQRGSSRS
jgi:hypothetical protein